jgi:hypothetical protein
MSKAEDVVRSLLGEESEGWVGELEEGDEVTIEGQSFSVVDSDGESIELRRVNDGRIVTVKLSWLERHASPSRELDYSGGVWDSDKGTKTPPELRHVGSGMFDSVLKPEDRKKIIEVIENLAKKIAGTSK